MLIISGSLITLGEARYLTSTPMELQFSKWHGTGNDFILIDDRKSVFGAPSTEKVQALCDRHFGIGSDGLILIQAPREQDTAFHMEFFNPDGSQSFCGNGSRCAYAFYCELQNDRAPHAFTAIDGGHEGAWRKHHVSVSLRRTGPITRESDAVDLIHTGSPHELVWVEDPHQVDLIYEGSTRRYDPKRAPGGTNVNFLKAADQRLTMRTYERGVEAETLSCGTGVVAAALSAISRKELQAPVHVVTKGGELWVEAAPLEDGGWDQIRLIGPVKKVFTGAIEI